MKINENQNVNQNISKEKKIRYTRCANIALYVLLFVLHFFYMYISRHIYIYIYLHYHKPLPHNICLSDIL